MTFDLLGLWMQSQLDGWATNCSSLSFIRVAASKLGWVEVPMRTMDASVSQLVPTTKVNAQPLSLSAKYGLGPQPLHTDGAHLRHPPDVVVMCCDRPNSTPTALFPLPSAVNSQNLGEWLDAGIYVVEAGREQFLATARIGSGVRFDPGCMHPADLYARRATEYFAKALASAPRHRWTMPQQVLLIDNRNVLHARMAVHPGDTLSRRLTRIGFSTGGRLDNHL